MASTGLTQPSLLQQATSAFNSAQQADKVLNEKSQPQQNRAEVLKVINAYQRVYLITPKTSYADDALLAKAATRWAFIDFATGTLARIPAEVIASFELVAD